MTKKHKMSLSPPVVRSAEEFISAAGHVKPKPAVGRGGESYPWEMPEIREDVIKSVNLRLSEPYIVKLQYLAKITGKSQQVIIRDILLPGIDIAIEETAK